MATKSRLSKNVEKKTMHRLWLSLIGIVVVLFLLIKFGIPALINFSLFLANSKDSAITKEQKANNPTVVLPPTLIQSFSATNSAQITVSGSAQANEQIELFVNNNLFDITNTKNDGSFTFTGVNLSSGQNNITAKAKVANKESDFSNTLSISYANKAPSLTIATPSDGQTFSGGSQQNLVVSGKTDNGDVRVTVNGFWAIVDASGNYSYTLTLQNGGNPIKVIAEDSAGNQTEKDINVTFNQ